jgi:hypothetical protein
MESRKGAKMRRAPSTRHCSGHRNTITGVTTQPYSALMINHSSFFASFATWRLGAIFPRENSDEETDL